VVPGSLSGSTVLCKMPGAPLPVPGQNDVVLFGILLNGTQVLPQLPFVRLPPLRLSSAHLIAKQGPLMLPNQRSARLPVPSYLGPGGQIVQQGSIIVLLDEPFYRAAAVTCRFPQGDVAAIWNLQEDWLLECPIPLGAQVAPTLSLKLPGDDNVTMVPTEGWWCLAPSVEYVERLQGPARGGTLVNLWGKGLQGVGLILRCRFGSLGDVVASCTNSSYCSCRSPPATWPSMSVPLLLVVGDEPGTLLDPRFMSNPMFRYQAEPANLAVQPPMGSQNGGTVVRLSPWLLDAVPPQLRTPIPQLLTTALCRFGESDRGVVRALLDHGLTEPVYVCITPPLSVGFVNVYFH